MPRTGTPYFDLHQSSAALVEQVHDALDLPVAVEGVAGALPTCLSPHGMTVRFCEKSPSLV